jgi:hypothetical protein
MHSVFGSFRITAAAVGLEEEMERLQKARDQLNQERARVLENVWKVGEELRTRNWELTGKISFNKVSENSFIFVARY